MVEFPVSQEQSDDLVAIWIFLVGRFFTRIIVLVYRKFSDAEKNYCCLP